MGASDLAKKLRLQGSQASGHATHSHNTRILAGEYAFSGPTRLYSFNLHVPSVIYKLIDGTCEHPYALVGGADTGYFERVILEPGEYLIRWNFTTDVPCDVDPVFHQSPAAIHKDFTLVCIKRTGSDEPSVQAWVHAGYDACTDTVLVELYALTGERLDNTQYTII